MSSDEQRDDPQPKRLIYEIREKVQVVRNQFWREAVQGYVTQSTKKELAITAVQYYDVLSEHSEEKAVKRDWKDAGVDWIREAIGATETVAVEAPGDTDAVEYEERPAVMQLDGLQIVRVTKDLDKLAKALGFGAQVRDPTHHDEATLEHLGEFTKARGQETAMDHLGVDIEIDEDQEGDEEQGGPTVIDE